MRTSRFLAADFGPGRRLRSIAGLALAAGAFLAAVDEKPLDAGAIVPAMGHINHTSYICANYRACGLICAIFPQTGTCVRCGPSGRLQQRGHVGRDAQGRSVFLDVFRIDQVLPADA